MNKKVTIALDAMGGDYAPEEIVKGAVEGALEYDVSIILVGDKKKIEKELLKYKVSSNISIEKAAEVIDMSEHAARAVRLKEESSIVVAAKLCKEDKADVLLSAGNTGAVMTAALLNWGRIKGISRPAIAVIIPTPIKPVVFLDVGANAECKPENLLQFARMGRAYSANVLNVSNPTVGLLNIGEEKKKGNELVQATYSLLDQSGLNFVGNVEGRDFLNADADVVVCDGFTGNVALKLMEGMADLFFAQIKNIFTSSLSAKIGASLLKSSFKKLKLEMDYEEYGGAQLLGVNGVCIITHGSSKSKGIKCSIRVAHQTVVSRMIEEIKKDIEEAGR
ncbi:MAG: phosphate acyltransferase PlsX [Actinobacteria bacterium]|nr:phosphate acyltransferase PlsX [Actinomycetota bacterium]